MITYFSVPKRGGDIFGGNTVFCGKAAKPRSGCISVYRSLLLFGTFLHYGSSLFGADNMNVKSKHQLPNFERWGHFKIMNSILSYLLQTVKF